MQASSAMCFTHKAGTRALQVLRERQGTRVTPGQPAPARSPLAFTMPSTKEVVQPQSVTQDTYSPQHVHFCTAHAHANAQPTTSSPPKLRRRARNATRETLPGNRDE
jgi:hypothetical protein